MIDPKSQVGRLCSAASLPLALPVAPLYGFDAARDAALALAAKLTASRPHLREDAEQAALLAAWEATERGTREVEFAAIDAAVRRAVRDVIDDLTEKRREAADSPAYTVDYIDLIDAGTEAESWERETLLRLRRVVERYGVETVMRFARFRYGGGGRRFSAVGAGRRSGIYAHDARELDVVLRRVNPAYRDVIAARRAAARATK